MIKTFVYKGDNYMSKQILNDFAEGLVLRGSVRATALPGAIRLEANNK